ncbi:sorbosone dehydrogenase family protein [Marixanthomonas sp. SCSIO 43207]|uniref:PQQ-dependent sugar dehydrogenase n=1 Tax=Marixanthomonas sp. SCSIO 43207 TaxID=2779360 RepID=UPI001CAA0D95|nr:sorbosone dehydrogenase family protein [Marixanthomonas sp. SCSIO 43207]UAB80897.1 sorbosone dehydrogenase family protein [Marixanthomonas sp. SCSIO 43207]
MKKITLVLLIAFTLLSCKQKVAEQKAKSDPELAKKEYTADTVKTSIGDLILPAPYATKSTAKVYSLVEWPENTKPKAPEGFTVSKFADGFDNPRWTYIAPNGDFFVVESNTRNSANKITLLRDQNNDGTFEVRETFLENLNQPFGMLVVGKSFYVANTDGLYKYPYTEGQTSLKDVEGTKIVDLPAGGYNNHWTRNIITNDARNKIYISVGSASNVGEYGMEEEKRRANILEVNLDGTGEKVYASGLRNPVGMDWNPITGELWTAVNERDKLGDNLVPDYITSVKKGGFYGWPYSYYGQIEDPRMKDKADSLVDKAIMPDVPVGSHTASLGFTFYTANQFPEKYKNGAFIGQHGSWNRSKFSGYKVTFVPFSEGKPTGKQQDFLNGFIANESEGTVYGRPVGVTVTPNGALLVNDDTGNTIWKISYNQ